MRAKFNDSRLMLYKGFSPEHLLHTNLALTKFLNDALRH
jgi:hypothetical protein